MLQHYTSKSVETIRGYTSTPRTSTRQRRPLAIVGISGDIERQQRRWEPLVVEIHDRLHGRPRLADRDILKDGYMNR